MKILIGIVFTGLVLTSNLLAQAVPPAPGPGSPLPANSKVVAPPDLTGLRRAALDIADMLKTSADELASFLAILALIHAGYHAQYRRFEEFVSTILRVIIAFALLASFREMLPYFFEARNEFLASLPVGMLATTAGVGAMLGAVGIGTFIMGPTGIALAIAIALTALGILIIHSAQILFEAILVALSPLAIACIAFRRSTGIFISWLKTFIAVLLIPVGWTLALMLGKYLWGMRGDTVTQAGSDLAASFVYIAAAGAIYIGMPILTAWLVNQASAAAAASMPSPPQLFSSQSPVLQNVLSQMIQSRMSGGTSSFGKSSATSVPSVATSPISSTSTSSANQTGSYGERIRVAQSRHPKS